MIWSDIGWIWLGDILSVTTLLALAAGLLSKNLRITIISGLIINIIGAAATYVHLIKHYPDTPEIIAAAMTARVLTLSVMTLAAYRVKVHFRKKPADPYRVDSIK